MRAVWKYYAKRITARMEMTTHIHVQFGPLFMCGKKRGTGQVVATRNLLFGQNNLLEMVHHILQS